MTLIEVAQLILILSASAACISLIIYLNRLVKSLDAIKEDVSKVTSELHPLLKSLQELSDSLLTVSDELRSNVDKVTWIVDGVKEKFENIFEFEQRIEGKLEEPIDDLLKKLAAIKNGLSTFWRVLKNR